MKIEFVKEKYPKYLNQEPVLDTWSQWLSPTPILQYLGDFLIGDFNPQKMIKDCKPIQLFIRLSKMHFVDLSFLFEFYTDKCFIISSSENVLGFLLSINRCLVVLIVL